MVDFDQRVEFKRNELCIIGAGPAGLSAAAHCAELSIPYVLLEAADHASNTIYKYQKGKHVMAEPQILPLRSTLSFAAASARRCSTPGTPRSRNCASTSVTGRRSSRLPERAGPSRS